MNTTDILHKRRNIAHISKKSIYKVEINEINFTKNMEKFML